MNNQHGQLLPRAALSLFANKHGALKLIEGKGKFVHGMNAWAEFDGVPERVPFYFNDYLPKDTPWIDRWVSLEVLRKTPKPMHYYEGLYINRWLQEDIAKGRVVIVCPEGYRAVRDHKGIAQLEKIPEEPAAPEKTEGVGHRPDHRTAPPIGGAIYA